jgi:hypothetical protein
VPALGTHPRFIEALAGLTQTMLEGRVAGGGFGCAEGFSRCARGRAEAA